MRAVILIRQKDPWPWKQVYQGLSALGVDCQFDTPNPDRADICVTWNEYGARGTTAKMFREAGKLHLCLENGPHLKPGQCIIQIGGHNGPMYLRPDGGGDRADWLLGMMKPWKKPGSGIALICGQRGGQYSPLAMPKEWPNKMAERLSFLGFDRILYRAHPERSISVPLPYFVIKTDTTQPISYDLPATDLVSVFSSMSAIHAVLRGIPATFSAERFIASEVVYPDNAIVDLNDPMTLPFPDREPFFRKLAWNLWDLDEVASGEAFKMYLDYAR